MAKELDIIVFGATGFTGKQAVPWIHKLSTANNRNLTWGIAGRSEKKLKDILNQCKEKVGTSLSHIPIIIASVENEESLNEMARKARIIINCCGPYRFFGEPVVKACVQQGTHHVDVSGEPQYMEKIELKYKKQAQEKGIYIISACGLDSIPTDLGLVFLQQKFKGTLNSANTYLTGWIEDESLPGPSFNFGTWESAVYALAHANELKIVRKQLYPKRLPTFWPRLEAKKFPHKTDVVEGWALPFLGSDRSVVRRSQRCFYENDAKRPVQVETYFMLKSFFKVLKFAFFGMIFGILARFTFGRYLLLKYPDIFGGGLFSNEAPSEEINDKSWFSVTFYGEGWKEKLSGPEDKYTTSVDQAICTKVEGRNPLYGVTCVCVVLAAITILTETDKMPSKGGVYPPGYAFAKTSLIQELAQNGVTFDVLYEKELNIKSKY